MTEVQVRIIIGLINSLSLMSMIVFLLSNTATFQKTMYGQSPSRWGKLFLALVFGLFGILGTYHGLPVDGAIANSRAVAVVAAGLLGGPAVGIGAGLIAGGHRYLIDIGGFTAFACGLSTALGGVVGALMHPVFLKARSRWTVGFGATVIAEVLQMILIVIIARPFEAAVALVEKIGLPMIILNAVGVAVFVLIHQTIYKSREQEAAHQSELALKIAQRTLPILRQGYNSDTALQACQIIFEEAKVDAVSMTLYDKILAHVGEGVDHHLPGSEIRTRLTLSVLETGKIGEAQTAPDIACSHQGCPLKAAVIVPLHGGAKVIGALKLYRSKSYAITAVERRLAEGLASLFSTQLELAEKDLQEKFLARAELRALQAQINPHFLFNALNTVVSFCRTQPETARRLLLHLADFMRTSFVHNPDIVLLSKEMRHVEAYLEIEKARFGQKLEVLYDLQAEDFALPPLILQPLVENAVRHGILPNAKGGSLRIQAISELEYHTVTISDSGVGFEVNNTSPSGNGIGLKNVDMRLRSLYGPQFGLSISSQLGQGTVCTVRIPRGVA